MNQRQRIDIRFFFNFFIFRESMLQRSQFKQSITSTILVASALRLFFSFSFFPFLMSFFFFFGVEYKIVINKENITSKWNKKIELDN